MKTSLYHLRGGALTTIDSVITSFNATFRIQSRSVCKRMNHCFLLFLFATSYLKSRSSACLALGLRAHRRYYPRRALPFPPIIPPSRLILPPSAPSLSPTYRYQQCVDLVYGTLLPAVLLTAAEFQWCGIADP